jgi:hypothetical protein
VLETRCLRWVGPGLVAIGTLGLVTSAALGAGARPWTPRPCGAGASDRTAAAQMPGPRSPADLGSQAWFRIDPIIDDTGTLQGQSVSLGLDGAGAARTVELPAESFASGPFGRLVLIGSDDGSVSRLRAIDVVTGCTWAVAEEPAVIRRATMDPAAGIVYEAWVDRASRTDLGVWSRPFGTVAPARSVLPPIGPDDRFGRTFSTEFSWSTDGGALAVQSCGEVACRTRIVGVDGRPGQELAEPDLGLLAGFDGKQIVTYEACRGLPCPIVATDLASGARRVLADEAGLAAVVETSEGPRLVHETFDATGLRLRSVSLDDGSARDLGPLPAGLRLESTPDRTGGATRSPIDWILLVPDRDTSVDAVSFTPQLRHLSDGATVQLDEVVR